MVIRAGFVVTGLTNIWPWTSKLFKGHVSAKPSVATKVQEGRGRHTQPTCSISKTVSPAVELLMVDGHRIDSRRRCGTSWASSPWLPGMDEAIAEARAAFGSGCGVLWVGLEATRRPPPTRLHVASALPRAAPCSSAGSACLRHCRDAASAADPLGRARREAADPPRQHAVSHPSPPPSPRLWTKSRSASTAGPGPSSRRLPRAVGKSRPFGGTRPTQVVRDLQPCRSKSHRDLATSHPNRVSSLPTHICAAWGAGATFEMHGRSQPAAEVFAEGMEAAAGGMQLPQASALECQRTTLHLRSSSGQLLSGYQNGARHETNLQGRLVFPPQSASRLRLLPPKINQHDAGAKLVDRPAPPKYAW
ncbi:hypothetical protein FH972_026372 [Carpinus fangiana]|uniref:Uncharacterized protein n=1 Tax=Carpinus fangiana TaxID=176857 RepID=A0A5N6L3S9_9ROSI|nr:hypothetical protein FH972_026372 [Carpinus fangiana]